MYFMISRIAYSPHGVKNQPVVSLTYGQLFDRNWNEVKNINLLVPSNDPSRTVGMILLGSSHSRIFTDSILARYR